MTLRSVLVIYQQPSYREERLSMEAVKRALKENGLKQRWMRREKVRTNHTRGEDLLLSLGGDGTYLSAAHVCQKDQPILGVNADISRKEGFLLRSDRKNISSVLAKILDGKYDIEALDTLEARVNGKRLPMVALNEFFVGSDKPYLTARYEVKLSKRKETHRSSGLLVATSTGMHAWAGSAMKKRLGIKRGEAGYVVREPYQQKVFRDYQITQGKLKKGQSITFVSKMRRAIVVADSLSEEFALRKDDSVTIGISTKKIAAIRPKTR